MKRDSMFTKKDFYFFLPGTPNIIIFGNFMSDGCQMGVRWCQVVSDGVRWVSDGCQMGVRGMSDSVRWFQMVSDGCQEGVRWCQMVSDGCQMGVR